MNNNLLSIFKVLLRTLTKIKIILMLVLLFIVMSFVNPIFSSWGNIINILSNVSIEGIIAIGMTYIIIVKEFDLSVGTIMGLSCVFAVFFQKYGVVAGLSAGILAGLLVGLINGWIVTRYKLPGMGVTLATYVALSGLILVLTKQQTIFGSNPNFVELAEYPLFGIPVIIIVFFTFTILFEFILQRTNFGRNVLACGGNIDACRYAGINVNRIKMATFMITGFLCGVAGVLMVAKYNSAGAVIGTNTAFYIITAVLLGGTSLAGGEGSILKSFQGMLFIGTLDSMLYFLNTGTGWRNVLIGAILVVTVIADSITRRRKRYL